MVSFLALYAMQALAQNSPVICGTPSLANTNTVTTQSYSSNPPGNGKYITAHGTLKVLVVFAQFPDDHDSTISGWADGQPPDMMPTFIDSTTSEQSTNKYNLTNYFNTMSMGKFHVIGKAVYVKAPHNSSYYASYNTTYKYYPSDKEVLQDKVDPLVNFNSFDTWSNYNGTDSLFTNQPDGKVDMVIVIWRSSPFFAHSTWDGEASLGSSSDYYVENSQEEILAYDPEYGGSGVTVNFEWPGRAFDLSIHEMAHYLISAHHPYYRNHPIYAYWSLFYTSYNLQLANAYEREFLGWITVPEITGQTSVTLSDYVTTGAARKYHPPNGNPGEYFYFENHQYLNQYDNASVNTADKGIYVLHLNGNYSDNESNVRAMPSDGDWTWDNPGDQKKGCFGGTDNVFVLKKDTPDPVNGYSHRDQITAGNNGASGFLYALLNDQGQAPCGNYPDGYDFYDAFNSTNKPLWASITNPDTRQWNGDTTHFAMQVTGQSGSDVDVTFDPDYDPYQIDHNTTWAGQIYLDQNVEVDGAVLTIKKGTDIYLGPNVEIIVRPGANIAANGTSADPIHFQRQDTSQQWNTVVLQGNGNTFTWCLFEGASTNVSVESDNNQFNHCTFRNAWRGIGTYYNQSGDGQLSYFKLNYCMVEDNTSVGVVVYHADAGFAHTTIQHNASAGLWLYDSPAHDFFETAITDNATQDINRAGVEVVGGSDVILFTYDGVNYGPGQNRIADNPGNQVLNDYSSDVNLGIPNTPDYGFNGIFGGAYWLVDNESSSTVSAGENWWGTTSPSSSLFTGPVDYSYYLTFDPSGGAGVGSGNYPGAMAPSVSEPVLVEGQARETSSGTAEVKMITSSTAASTTEKQEREIRREQMHTLWSEIAQASDAQSKVKDIRELYLLHLMSLNDTSFTSERKQDRTIWDGTIRDYLSGSQTVSPSLSASQAEHLMLMDIHEAYRFGRYGEAAKKMAQYEPYITSAKGKIALMINQMNLLDHQGAYKDELTLLDKVKQAEISLGTSEDRVNAEYQMVGGLIQDAMNRKSSGAGAAGSASAGENSGNTKDIAPSDKPAKTTLKANYPNPFNPTTTIRYRLAKSGHVRLTVYDVLGRRIATLVDANQQKGAHQVTFKASQLSSGVYFYRLRSGNKVFVKKMLVMK